MAQAIRAGQNRGIRMVVAVCFGIAGGALFGGAEAQDGNRFAKYLAVQYCGSASLSKVRAQVNDGDGKVWQNASVFKPDLLKKEGVCFKLDFDDHKSEDYPLARIDVTIGDSGEVKSCDDTVRENETDWEAEGYAYIRIHQVSGSSTYKNGCKSKKYFRMPVESLDEFCSVEGTSFRWSCKSRKWFK